MSATSHDIHNHLIDLLRANDRAAQKKIYEMYAGPMFHVSFRILNSREEAEDILQEAFIDMFHKINSFRGESTFGAWFKRIVTNKSINQLKKKKYFSEDIEKVANVEEADEESEEELTFSVEQIKTAVSKLSDGFRTVFVLYMFEDYSHQEIAEELEISTGTSKSQLSRAKVKVKEWLISNKNAS